MVMADCYAFPFWSEPSGGMYQPTALPLSPELRDQLVNWGNEYTRALMKDSVYEWPNDDDHREWNERGRRLAAQCRLNPAATRMSCISMI